MRPDQTPTTFAPFPMIYIVNKIMNFNNVVRQLYTYINFVKCEFWIDMFRTGQRQDRKCPHYLGK